MSVNEEENQLALPNMPLTDRSVLSARENSLLDLAMDIEHGTPLFKIRHFVGDAQITRYAKFKQLLLEIRAREEIIEQTLVTLQKNKFRVEELKEQLESAPTPATRASAEWELASQINDVAKTERRLKMAYRERGLFIKALDEMYKNGTAYLADGTDLAEAVRDDDLSEQLEAEHWVYRLGKQAALDIIAYGHIGTGNLEAISMMDETQAVETLRLALAYSHGVKTALGTMEASVLEQIESGKIAKTTKIENMETPKEIEG